jgi:Uma2 family endonuclease
MSALPYVSVDGEAEESVVPWRWTRETYHAAAEAGVFEDAHVELLCGSVYVQMSPQSARHSSCLRKGIRLFSRILPEEFTLQVQQPVALDGESEPEPDLAILRAGADLAEHPSAEFVVLAIEVSETSLQVDRRRKGAIYAAAGISEYWVVNLVAGQVEVFREPQDGHYGQATVVSGIDIIRPLFAPELEIQVSDLLPKL